MAALRMKHPGTGYRAWTTDELFASRWAPLGWELVDDEDPTDDDPFVTESYLDGRLAGVTAGTAAKYVHTQAAPAAIWVVTHGLGSRPAVVLATDSDPGELVMTDVVYSDLNSLAVVWPSPETGKAYLS
jgi:hypothetical protein